MNVCRAASRESDRTLRIIIMWAASEGDKIGICYVHIANAGLLSDCSGGAEGCACGGRYVPRAEERRGIAGQANREGLLNFTEEG